jgi:excisionase family DNA binding protein
LSTNFSRELISPSDWISQAEAAQLRGVTRQAIAKLVRKGRLKSIVVGGHTLVSREDVLAFRPRASGRPRSDPDK